MFTKIRSQLLLSYLTVLTFVLTVCAIAVRITFAKSLNQQLIARLNTLARGAALELELEEGKLEVDNETLINQNQSIQWFDTKGNLLEQQGDYTFSLPLNPEQSIQIQITPHPAKSLTIPVNDYDTGIFIGYTRVSESTVDFNNTLRSLDWGLGTGVLTALILSGIGGIWLTNKAMQPIEKSFQRLKQFTADASHELRSPLMAIKSNTAVALKYSEGMRSLDKEKFQAISSATKQMTHLTEGLLLLARNDNVNSHNWEKINLREVLFDLILLHKPQAHEKQVNLKAQLTENLYLLGDKSLLAQLFTNLIQNALDYTPSGGLVEIETSSTHSELIIKVQDTGVGIASEHLDKVFERFWRSDQSRSYKTKKLGLGLAIAQTIAQKHGGLITVISELEVGSCFTVHLPLSSNLDRD